MDMGMVTGCRSKFDRAWLAISKVSFIPLHPTVGCPPTRPITLAATSESAFKNTRVVGHFRPDGLVPYPGEARE